MLNSLNRSPLKLEIFIASYERGDAKGTELRGETHTRSAEATGFY